MAETSLLSQMVMKNLQDKMYDKRRNAASEIETIVHSMVTHHDTKSANAILSSLKEYINSMHDNSRKGGLMGFAAVARGLGREEIRHFVSELLRTILISFSDRVPSVREQAAEACYNVMDIARVMALPFLGELFVGIGTLWCDADPHVRDMAEEVDRLFKEILVDADQMDVRKILKEVERHIPNASSRMRSYLMNWISQLNVMPDVNLLRYLPVFFPGLLEMLTDVEEEIRNEADHLLGKLLQDVRVLPVEDIEPFVKICIDQSKSSSERISVSSLNWIKAFLMYDEEKMAPFVPTILPATLLALGRTSQSVRNAAEGDNDRIRQLVGHTSQRLDFSAMLKNILTILGANNRLVQEAVLKWVIIISQESMDAVFQENELIKSCVLAFLSDETCSDDIIFLALDVMGILCTREDIFNDFMKNFVGILSTYKPIRRLIGEMIRPLCTRLDSETVIRSLAEIIPQHDEDLQFVSHMVYEVNMVLLTSAEMASVRDSIRRCHEDPEGQELFRLLFPCWIRNSVSAISLSLLAQAYDLSASIIREMAMFEVNMTILLQLDKLVQLVESPIFAHMRMHLLDPGDNHNLLRTLYGILMLLPQSNAYELLSSRLENIAPLALLQALELKKPAEEEKTTLDVEKLVKEYVYIQRRILAPPRKIDDTSSR